MLVQKIFHIHQPLTETRERLANIGTYCHELSGVSRATITADGVGHFEFKMPSGHVLAADVAEVPNDAPDQVLFCSIGGNMQLNGMLEFFEVRDNITEIVLTLDYHIESPLHRMMDRMTSAVDRFLNRQLMCIQTHFDGLRSFAQPDTREEAQMPAPMPQFAEAQA